MSIICSLIKIGLKNLPKVDEPEDKIVGGEDVDISERPFQVVFEWYGSLICGGAWIGGNKVQGQKI